MRTPYSDNIIKVETKEEIDGYIDLGKQPSDIVLRSEIIQMHYFGLMWEWSDIRYTIRDIQLWLSDLPTIEELEGRIEELEQSIEKFFDYHELNGKHYGD